jgi:hypothetical protein
MLAYLKNLNFSFEDRASISENLIPMEELGEGTFGNVRKLFDGESRIYYAEKCIKKHNSFKRDILNEVLAAFHVHIVDREELLQIFKLIYNPG